MSESNSEKKKSGKLLYIAAGLLLLLVVGVGIVGWNAWVQAERERSQKKFQEAQEHERQKKEPGGAFDSNDFDATARWLAGEQLTVQQAEEQKNELLAKEAKLTMVHTLGGVEGKPVRWSMSVASVSERSVTLQPIYWFETKAKKQIKSIIYVGDGHSLVSDGFAIGDKGAISLDQASRLKAKEKVVVAGTISSVSAAKVSDGWEFLIKIGKAKIK